MRPWILLPLAVSFCGPSEHDPRNDPPPPTTVIPAAPLGVSAGLHDGGSRDTPDSGPPVRCVPELPSREPPPPDDPGPGGDPGPGDAGTPTLDTTGLLAHWPLDGSWVDTVSGRVLIPTRAGGFSATEVARAGANEAYGPTGSRTDNGAADATLTSLDRTDGLTLEGWLFKTNHDTGGVLFGLGDGRWGTPSLVVSDSWGFISVTAGDTGGRSVVRYPRPSLGCWHHVALVVSADPTAEITLYVDGDAQSPVDGSPVLPSTGLDGSAFTVGGFTGTYGGEMRLDEVRVWERALAPEEVREAATPGGTGAVCPGSRLSWEPGPRCNWSLVTEPAWPVVSGEVRVLTNDTIMVVHDPTRWLQARMDQACGPYLAAMDAAMAEGTGPQAWWAQYQRDYAYAETVAREMPTYIGALAQPDHFQFATCGRGATTVVATSHWPAAVAELEVPDRANPTKTHRLAGAQVAWTTTLSLPAPMVPGDPVALQDRWGNRHDFTFDPDTTVSWALKVDQEGFPEDAPAKYGYLGAWLGSAGSLDLSRFDGAPFDVVEVGSGRVGFTGTIAHRSDDPLSGESVYELDFSAFTEPGDYYLRVAGLGRSHTFQLGQDALGHAFYTYARGMYHNRCGTELSAAHTHWTRGDAHVTYEAAFPPDESDYRDHSADGWGFLDTDGNHVALTPFQVVAATATEIERPSVRGGWHDAGDYDRRPYHLRSVLDLITAWRLAPDHFTDGQLQIPESGNGLPDILDEARWGIEVLRLAQTTEGGVGTWIEATSHPRDWDPTTDIQPYYLALATRSSSLEYAEHAARLGRALADAGDPSAGALYIDSAARAYAFGTDPDRRVATTFVHDGRTITFTEAPSPDSGRRLWAAVQLWLATGEATYAAALDDDAFSYELANLWWQNRIYTLVDVVLDGSNLPEGWADRALSSIQRRADTFVAGVDQHAYRRAWYPPDHGYFTLEGWGSARYMPLRPLVVAWRLTHDDTYRRAALLGLNYLHGANPLGRVHVTGLGDHGSATALHLPSWADDHDEPVPGIPLYGPGLGVPSVAARRVYGIFEAPRTSPPFAGIDQALLPPPWHTDGLDYGGVSDVLRDILPPWRRMVPLESQVVASMEFTVWETTSVAASVTGLLMGAGWEPAEDAWDRRPRTDAELTSHRWALP